MSDQLDRLTTALADRYTIERELGAGGRWPTWRDNGRELYFLSPEGGVYVADLTSVLAGRAPSVPRVLFRHPLGRGVSSTDTGTGFGATPDGLTFYIRPQTESHNIVLDQNWLALLERR